MTSYRWRPIEDLPHDWRILADPELPALGVVWKSGPQATDAMERVKRAASIETGAIEGVYRIERRVTDLLIERGIKAALIPHGTTDLSPEEVAHRIKQNGGALEMVFARVASREPMTESFIKQLHASLILPGETSRARRRDGAFVDVEILRGDYKKWPNNPQRADGSVHEYCPPEHVASEMERLVRVHADHERLSVAPEAESAWLHHAFTQIHPFQDGNGRVARLLASMVLIRAGLFPMVVRMAERSAYIDSLERADAGDYSPLVQLIAKQQRSEILAVFKASGEDRARQPLSTKRSPQRAIN